MEILFWTGRDIFTEIYMKVYWRERKANDGGYFRVFSEETSKLAWAQTAPVDQLTFLADRTQEATGSVPKPPPPHQRLLREVAWWLLEVNTGTWPRTAVNPKVSGDRARLPVKELPPFASQRGSSTHTGARLRTAVNPKVSSDRERLPV